MTLEAPGGAPGLGYDGAAGLPVHLSPLFARVGADWDASSVRLCGEEIGAVSNQDLAS